MKFEVGNKYIVLDGVETYNSFLEKGTIVEYLNTDQDNDIVVVSIEQGSLSRCVSEEYQNKEYFKLFKLSGKKCFWEDDETTSYKCIHWFKEPNHTHQGFISNIQEIKKETAEDVLRDIIKYNSPFSYTTELHDRAKKVLGDS